LRGKVCDFDNFQADTAVTPAFLVIQGTSYLYIFSLVLLITGFLCIWSAWHGDANFTSGIPVGLSSIQLCGSATGSRTLAGFLSGIVGMGLYGVALLRTVLNEIDR
jgi:hypothetical protein